jgi:hypothetical protein
MKGNPYLRSAADDTSRRFASSGRDGWKILYCSSRECYDGYDRIDTGACWIGHAGRGDFPGCGRRCNRPPQVPRWFHGVHPLFPYDTPRRRLYRHAPTLQTSRCQCSGRFFRCPAYDSPYTLAGYRKPRVYRPETRSSGRSDTTRSSCCNTMYDVSFFPFGGPCRPISWSLL